MKPIIVVDVEATCSKNRDVENEIIEIGAVKIVDGKIVSEYDSFVKPVKTPILTDFCKELTTIRQEDVDSAKEFPEVFRDFLNWIGTSDFILMSWGFYDKNQFMHDCWQHGLDYKWIKKHNNIKLEFAKKYHCRQCGMDRALRMIGLDLIGTHHRGIDDAKNIARIYLEMHKEDE